METFPSAVQTSYKNCPFLVRTLGQGLPVLETIWALPPAAAAFDRPTGCRKMLRNHERRRRRLPSSHRRHSVSKMSCSNRHFHLAYITSKGGHLLTRSSGLVDPLAAYCPFDSSVLTDTDLRGEAYMKLLPHSVGKEGYLVMGRKSMGECVALPVLNGQNILLH